MLFKTKPVVVEARQIPENPTFNDLVEIFQWLKDSGLAEHWGRPGSNRFELYQANTRIRSNFGDWIVKTAAGGVAVYKPDIFDQTFSWIGPAVYADAPYMVN